MKLQYFLKQLKRIDFHTRLKSQEAIAGMYHSAFKGRGMTFSECKPYEESDDARYIDWHATARQQGTFVKTFIEERELSVCIILDLSASMRFGSLGRTKADTGIEAMSILAFSALHNNDKVGLSLFNEVGMKYIPQLKGKNNIVRLIIEALKLSPERGAHSLSEVMAKTIHLMKRRSLIFVISDFLHRDYENVLRLLSHRHVVMPIVVSDPIESKMPDLGFLHAKDMFTGEYLFVDSRQKAFRDHYKKQFEERAAQQQRIFDKSKITAVRISTVDDILQPITRAFNRRANRF